MIISCVAYVVFTEAIVARRVGARVNHGTQVRPDRFVARSLPVVVVNGIGGRGI